MVNVKVTTKRCVSAVMAFLMKSCAATNVSVDIKAASRRVMILDLYFFIKAMPRNFCKLLPFTILCFLYFTPKRDESQTHFTVK